jgi:uncharacterized protein (TIGR03437 family)
VQEQPVQYPGSAPTLVCGIVQINFQIPVDVAPGMFSFLPWIQFEDENTWTQSQPQIGATIAVK